MNVKSVEKLEKSQVAVTVEVTAEEFEAAVQKAYLKMRNKISVPGFRPGKAPRKMIEKLYGEGVFYSDAVDAALPDAYTQAIGSSGLDVVGYPEVEIVDDQIGKDGFTFKATVAVYPEVELGQYKGVSAVKEEVKVTADDVKERLNQMAEREARLVSVDRKVKKGDTAVIDFEGFDNGVAFEGGKGENHELEIGSGSFVPGFEDQIIGMKAGEEKDIDITFPENYTKDLAGKQVVFHVKVNEVKEKQTPALDDEFAKDVSEFETLKELKTRRPDKKNPYRARVVVVGSEVDDIDFIKLVEDTGAYVCADRFCYGSFPGRDPITLTDDEDALTQICRQYMNRAQCPRYMDMPKMLGRREYVSQLAKEYAADGIIYEQIKFCDPWAYERMLGSHILNDDYGYPVLSVDRPYNIASSGQMRTRVQAFVESMEIKKIQGGKQ